MNVRPDDGQPPRALKAFSIDIHDDYDPVTEEEREPRAVTVWAVAELEGKHLAREMSLTPDECPAWVLDGSASPRQRRTLVLSLLFPELRETSE